MATVSPSPTNTSVDLVKALSTVQQERGEMAHSVAVTITPMETQSALSVSDDTEIFGGKEDLVFDLDNVSWDPISCCARFFCRTKECRKESYQNYWQYLLKEIGGSNLVFLLLSNLAKKRFDFYQATVEKRQITKKITEFLKTQKESVQANSEGYKRILQAIQRIQASIQVARNQISISVPMAKEEQDKIDSMGSVDLDLSVVYDKRDPVFSRQQETSPTARRAEDRLKQVQQQQRRQLRAANGQRKYTSLTVLPNARALANVATHTAVEVEVALRNTKYKDLVRVIATKLEKFSDLVKGADKEGLREQPVWLTEDEIGNIIHFSRGDIDTSEEQPITPNTSLQIPTTLVHAQPSPLHYTTLDSPNEWKDAAETAPQQPRLSLSQVAFGMRGYSPTIAQLPNVQTIHGQSQSSSSTSSMSMAAYLTAATSTGICRTSHSFSRS